nr:hypothetical protein GCM10025699_06800 [Microbacterium flavescens]
MDWTSIGSARFVRQANREELVEAMIAVSAGAVRFADSEVIAADAAERFSEDRCLALHARVLREVAHDRGAMVRSAEAGR